MKAARDNLIDSNVFLRSLLLSFRWFRSDVVVGGGRETGEGGGAEGRVARVKRDGPTASLVDVSGLNGRGPMDWRIGERECAALHRPCPPLCVFLYESISVGCLFDEWQPSWCRCQFSPPVAITSQTACGAERTAPSVRQER
jgi:hypothetical protein